MAPNISVVIFLLLQVHAFVNGEITSSAAECNNYAECIEHTINSIYVKCSGDLSCEGSSITSPTLSGYIKCSGDGSCKRCALTSTTNIECSGHESCYFADYLVADEEIKCDGSYSCYSNLYVSADPRIQSTNSDVLCQGTGSCLDSIIESNANTHCEADQSCLRTDIQSGNNIYCNGNLACSESKLSAINSIYCSGAQSCSKAASIDANIIHLLGYGSGFQSAITCIAGSSTIIKSFGHYAMAHAVVDSDRSDTLHIIAYGHYTAYAASVICRVDSICSLKCRGTGCNHLDFICLAGSACDIEPKECSVSESISSDTTSIDGTYCPNWHKSESIDTDTVYLDYLEQKQALYEKMEPETYEHHANDMERLPEEEVIAPIVASNQMVRCSLYQECEENTFVGDGYIIYCSAFESCHNAILGNLPGNTQSTINCMGANACANAQLSGAGDIRCGAERGCYHAQSIIGYDDSSRIECYGAASCQDVDDGITGNEIECHGTNACKGSVLQSIDYVQCDGYEACLEARIESKEGIIYCGGASSCSDVEIRTESEKVVCSAKMSCARSVIVSSSAIHLAGEQSGISAVLYGEIVEGFGHKSLELATVDSKGRESMTVKVYGYMAGNQASVICRKGSECQIKCESRGCFNMEVICLNGAVCNIAPKECLMDNSVDVFEGIDCPQFKTSASHEEDQVLIEYLEKKKQFDEELFYNKKKLFMVMQNEIIPYVYHRLYLYVAITVIVILVCILPICCYLSRVYGEMDENRSTFSIYSRK